MRWFKLKKLACELCGSEEFLKDEGLFVCQTCGCKYTLEEARKLMNDNMVNTTTTVKVDNTDQVKNFIELSENAFEVKKLYRSRDIL